MDGGNTHTHTHTRPNQASALVFAGRMVCLPLLAGTMAIMVGTAAAFGPPAEGVKMKVTFSPPVMVQRGPGAPSDGFFSIDPAGAGRALFGFGKQSFDRGETWSEMNNAWPHGTQFGGGGGSKASSSGTRPAPSVTWR